MFGRFLFRTRCEAALVAVACVFVAWFYWWTIKANNGFENWGDGDYYQLLVRGWKKGHLYLDKEPSAELLGLKDPYDPTQNDAYRLGDASLYRNRYYIYFGPAPAFTLMLPYSLITGHDMRVGQAVYVFSVLAFLAITALFFAIRRRYFPNSAGWTAPTGVVAAGFGTHLLALAQRPHFWELAIAGGAAFGALAVLATYATLHARRPWLPMAAAGLCLGLAVASRPTCLFGAPLLLVPLWYAWRRSGWARELWRLALAGGVPLVACGLAIMAHNYARFDNPLEWGQNYQLSGAYESKLTHFSPLFFPHNFAIYLFYPFKWTAAFPFTQAEGAPPCNAPGYFGTEEVAGLIATFPFFWFLLGLPLAWRSRPPEEGQKLKSGLTAIAAYSGAVMVLVMCYFSTCMRYETDFAPTLAVLALVGLLGAERWAQGVRWPVRNGLAGLGLAAGAATIVIGALMSLDYHGRTVQMASPVRWHWLEQNTNHVVATVGHWLGRIDGPRVLKVRLAQRPVGTIETFWQATDARAPERVLIQHAGPNLIKFGYSRGGDTPQWGRLLSWEPNHTHTVELQLPSLYPPARGWWNAARRFQTFRERTSVAVWFSGGRALEVVMPPLPAGVVAGGGVSREFSGEVRKLSRRLYRDDEVTTGLTEPFAKRGGTLQMHVVFNEHMTEKGEPLFAAGAHYRSSIVFAEPANDGQFRFVFENYFSPRIESPAFRPDPAGHLVELEMASFNPDAYGVEATGDVIVRLDGREMLRTQQVAYPFPWGDEQIGFNPFGTTCGTHFTGWIRSARWVQSANVARAGGGENRASIASESGR